MTQFTWLASTTTTAQCGISDSNKTRFYLLDPNKLRKKLKPLLMRIRDMVNGPCHLEQPKFENGKVYLVERDRKGRKVWQLKYKPPLTPVWRASSNKLHFLCPSGLSHNNGVVYLIILMSGMFCVYLGAGFESSPQDSIRLVNSDQYDSHMPHAGRVVW